MQRMNPDEIHEFMNFPEDGLEKGDLLYLVDYSNNIGQIVKFNGLDYDGRILLYVYDIREQVSCHPVSLEIEGSFFMMPTSDEEHADIVMRVLEISNVG